MTSPTWDHIQKTYDKDRLDAIRRMVKNDLEWTRQHLGRYRFADDRDAHIIHNLIGDTITFTYATAIRERTDGQQVGFAESGNGWFDWWHTDTPVFHATVEEVKRTYCIIAICSSIIEPERFKIRWNNVDDVLRMAQHIFHIADLKATLYPVECFALSKTRNGTRYGIAPMEN